MSTAHTVGHKHLRDCVARWLSVPALDLATEIRTQDGNSARARHRDDGHVSADAMLLWIRVARRKGHYETGRQHLLSRMIART